MTWKAGGAKTNNRSTQNTRTILPMKSTWEFFLINMSTWIKMVPTMLPSFKRPSCTLQLLTAKSPLLWWGIICTTMMQKWFSSTATSLNSTSTSAQTVTSFLDTERQLIALFTYFLTLIRPFKTANFWGISPRRRRNTLKRRMVLMLLWRANCNGNKQVWCSHCSRLLGSQVMSEQKIVALTAKMKTLKGDHKIYKDLISKLKKKEHGKKGWYTILYCFLLGYCSYTKNFVPSILISKFFNDFFIVYFEQNVCSLYLHFWKCGTSLFKRFCTFYRHLYQSNVTFLWFFIFLPPSLCFAYWPKFPSTMVKATGFQGWGYRSYLDFLRLLILIIELIN